MDSEDKYYVHVTKVLLSLERLFRVFWLQYIADSFSFGVEKTIISCETVASLSTMLVAI